MCDLHADAILAYLRVGESIRLLRRYALPLLLCLSLPAFAKPAERPRYEVVGYVMAPKPGALLDTSTIAAAKLTRINYAFFILKDGVIVERLKAAGCQPASTLLGVTRLAFPELLVEIEATAIA